ncbi:hypothetical protein AGMMS49546_35420 [Spirochaetia bacterium]|nr:hypothetical protein AGMMS49546_35420 [Spirochaetia bacterium]
MAATSWEEALNTSQSFNPNNQVSLTGGVFKNSLTAVNTSVTGMSISLTGISLAETVISQLGMGLQFSSGAITQVNCCADVSTKVVNNKYGLLRNVFRAMGFKTSALEND